MGIWEACAACAGAAGDRAVRLGPRVRNAFHRSFPAGRTAGCQATARPGSGWWNSNTAVGSSRPKC